MSLQRHHSRVAAPAFGSTFWTGLAEEVLITLAHSVVLFTGLGITLYALDPSRTSKSASKKYRENVNKKMHENGRVPFKMNDYEAIIALDLVYPKDIKTSFTDIGGLEESKKDIYDIICLPLQRLDLFTGKSDLMRPPKGILLFGPPGTGKTMMAKAIARESGAAFINLKVSTLMDKWFGESEKLVRATFTLAWKLSPCIIFIDELESFLKKRGQSVEHQAVSNMKAEFMSLWDGLNSNLVTSAVEEKSIIERIKSSLTFWKRETKTEAAKAKYTKLKKKVFGVVVIGATNRPGDIDDAVLRRMARTFLLDLPKPHQRHSILKLILKNEELSNDLKQNLPQLAANLQGYSGSDLKELCRAAAVIPLREMAQKVKANHSYQIRKLQLSDFLQAQQKVFATGKAAKAYQYNLDKQELNENVGIDPQVIKAINAMFNVKTASVEKKTSEAEG